MARLTLERLVLNNIMSYEREVLDFTRGSMALVGRNGAGKSTILESLYAALTGGETLRFPGRGVTSLLRREAKAGSIEAVFRDGDRGFVTAVIRLNCADRNECRRRNAEYVLHYRNREGQVRMLASGQKSYRRELLGLLGLSLPHPNNLGDFIQRAVIVPQGGLREIAESMEKPSKLREEIETAVGLPEYRRALQAMDSLTLEVSVGGRQESFKPGPQNLRRYEDALAQTRSRIEELEENLKRARGEKRALEERVRRLEGDLTSQRGRVTQLEAEKARLEAEVKRLEENVKRLAELEKRAQELKRRLEEVEKARSEIEKLRRLEKLFKQSEHYRRDQTRLSEYRSQLTLLQEHLRRAERIAELAPEERRLEELEQAYREAQKRLEEARAHYHSLHAHLQELAREEARLQERLQALQGERVEIASQVGLSDPTGLAERLGKLMGEARALSEEASKKKAEAEALLRQREKTLDALREARGDKCPLCGSPLDEEHRRRLEALLEDEVGRLRGEVQRWEAESRSWAERALRLEGLLSRARVLEERLRELEARLDELLKEKQALGAEASSVEAQLAKLEREARVLEESLDGVRDRVRELRLLRAELRREGYVEPERALAELRTRVERLRDTVVGLEASVKMFERRLLEETGEREPSAALRRLAEAVERLGRLRGLVEQEGLLRSTLEGILEEARRLGDSPRLLEEARSRLSQLERALGDARSELERLEEDRRRVEESLRSLEGSVRGLEERLREARELEESAAAKVRLTRSFLAVRVILERLMRLLYQRSLGQLENEMGTVLESFGLDPYQVSIDDTPQGPVLKVNTRTTGIADVSQLSGGEKSALALAYVIALNRIMASRIGFLALDEPTSELDDQRRKELVRILSQLTKSTHAGGLGAVEQLIVVTHHNEVSDSVDRVCTVEKPGGVSSVTCGQ